ncbi:MAG: glycosyltransferase [Oscillochloris sp.]|nr:glycosyltransferase [Oscillochloris sp.]
MQILFVSAYTPSRIRVRPYNFIRALARRGHTITLVCGAGSEDVAALEELRSICRRVVAVPQSRPTTMINALRAVPGDMPLQAALSFGPAMRDAVRNEVRRRTFDVAHIEHLRAAALGYVLHDLPTVLDSVDSISLLFERALRGSPSLKSRLLALVDLGRTRKYEASYADRFERVIVSSPEDAWALTTLRREHFPAAGSCQPPHVVPNGVDLDYFAPHHLERDEASLVLTGKMSYHANEAAALFLANEIMPLVWRERPEIRLVIAGSAPTRPVRELGADKRINVTGFVEDLRVPLAQAAVAVAPLRYGVGIQNKVLEAMAMGTPVVAARQVAHSLHSEDGHDLLLAQAPAEYARAILNLLDSAHYRGRLGRAGRAYVERHHNWDNAAADLEQIYAAAGGAEIADWRLHVGIRSSLSPLA